MTTSQMSVGVVDRANKDDRNEFAAGPLANQCRGFEAVHVRHADIQDNQRKFMLEKEAKGFLAGAYQDQVLPQTSQDRFERQQLIASIID